MQTSGHSEIIRCILYCISVPPRPDREKIISYMPSLSAWKQGTTYISNVTNKSSESLWHDQILGVCFPFLFLKTEKKKSWSLASLRYLHTIHPIVDQNENTAACYARWFIKWRYYCHINTCTFLFGFVCICVVYLNVHVYEYGHVHAMVCLGRTEDNLACWPLHSTMTEVYVVHCCAHQASWYMSCLLLWEGCFCVVHCCAH